MTRPCRCESSATVVSTATPPPVTPVDRFKTTAFCHREEYLRKDIPDGLHYLFSARIEDAPNDSYTVTLPEQELATGNIQPNTVYRIALLPATYAPAAEDEPAAPSDTTSANSSDAVSDNPPVHEGEIREVDIDDLGEQGDGIAFVDQGYVLIVPETKKGERVTVEITHVSDNVAFGEVVERQHNPQ